MSIKRFLILHYWSLMEVCHFRGSRIEVFWVFWVFFKACCQKCSGCGWEYSDLWSGRNKGLWGTIVHRITIKLINGFFKHFFSLDREGTALLLLTSGQGVWGPQSKTPCFLLLSLCMSVELQWAGALYNRTAKCVMSLRPPCSDSKYL